MKRSLQKIMVGLIFTFVVFKSEGVSQEFITSPLIDMPGNNLEFDVVTPQMGSHSSITFICWINKLDSIYTVYLKQLSPTVGNAMIVASDTYLKSKPQITSNTIGWQSMRDSLWQVSIRSYSSNSLDPAVILLDSLAADPQFTLSNYRIAWIQNKNLFAESYYPNLDTPFLVDSAVCSSPTMMKLDYTSNTEILYEKLMNGHKGISKAQFTGYPAPQWIYTLLAGDSARNPNYGIIGGVSFEIMSNQISRLQYSVYGSNMFRTTTNQACNYKNPSVFSYPIPIAKSTFTSTTPMFVAFDSDSIPGNNEIFVKTFYYENHELPTINVSQSPGNDVEPRICYVFSNDTLFVEVIWKHSMAGKTDIWMAKTSYIPPTGVEDAQLNVNSFKLMQNYPNPFNPATTITFSVGTYNYTSLRVYDVLGREVAVIFSGELPAGSYTKQWNASSLPSGIYFYRLSAGSFTETKKLVLLK